MTSTARTYPEGVTCWIDAEYPSHALDEALDFYGGLFSWTYTTATPPAGGTVLEAPADAGPGGRYAVVADPSGAVFRLWQARQRLGAQVSNVPGAWNFSDLHDPAPSVAFYRRVFPWQLLDLGELTMIQVPGYGDHLASTVDPVIHERQASAGAPDGFADVIGGISPGEPGAAPHWHVTFSVADRDEAADRAAELGALVVARDDREWTRTALVEDPAGARFTLSQFTPPAG